MRKKLFDHNWFVAIVSLAFALILATFISQEENMSFRAGLNQDSASVDITDTISNVPVYVGEKNPDDFVSGLPETVTIRLTGPRNVINQVTGQDLKVQTEDLSNLDTGTHTVRLVVKDLPKDIDYQVTPSRVVIQIAKRESIKMPIEYEIQPDTIAEGYSINRVTINPSQVTLTGKQETIDLVDRVVVKISTNEPATESFTRNYVVQILDAEGNMLDVNSSDSEVSVQVQLDHSDTKEVDIELSSTGEDNNRYHYGYRFTDTSKVVLQGEKNALDKIDSVVAQVDVSNLTQDATLNAKLKLPEGISSDVTSIPLHVAVKKLDSNESNKESEKKESKKESEENHSNEDNKKESY